MKKLLTTLTLSIVLYPLFQGVVQAAGEFTVITLYDPEGYVTTPLYYDSANDRVITFIRSSDAKTVVFKNHGDDSTFTNIVHEKSKTASDYGYAYWAGFYINCNAYYTAGLYDDNMNLLMEYKVHVTGIVNPLCDSSVDGDVGKGSACESYICECMQELKTVMSQVNDSINLNGQKLQTVIDEIQTSQPAPTFDISPVPSYKEPIQPQTPFTDTTTYFSDSGQANEIPALPIAPEPKDWTFNGLPVLKESPLVSSPVGKKDSVLISDDVLGRTNEKVKDVVPVASSSPIQDSVPLQDSIPTKDVVPSKELPKIKDNVLIQDKIPVQDSVPVIDRTVYVPRINSH